ncbi:hypothetical protein J3R83DRAFT_12848 [Lanmaoa asiatica]|nr:hypothetical protein J3R83DRAFT_12848 [Lanmaoa asiatica]
MEDSAATSSTSTSSSIFSTSPTPTTSTLTSTTNVGSQTASPAGTSNANTNVGAIAAGIVVGSVAFILATAAFIVYMRRRRPCPTAREYLMPNTLPSL